jgi:bacillithiol biosynthesis cysteine-adding enzyme BshC
MTNPMECHCIRGIDVPHATPLYNAYIDNFSAVSAFFEHPPTVDSVRETAKEARLDPASRRQVVAVLRSENRRLGADAAVEASLDRLEAGAVAVVSGQQVGLFSGPSYTFYKALTALRLAEDLSAAGRPAVAVFWLATEDHDLAEVNHSLWFSRSGTELMELPLEDSAGGRRVGEVPLGENVRALALRAAALLEGPGSAAITQAIEECYSPSETYGSAFGKLIARMFAGRGLILLDPLSPELHRLAAPLFRAALEQHTDLRRDLLDRGKALDRAGYHAQVKVTERNTLLFINVDGKRLPLRARNHGFVLGQRELSLPQAIDLLDASPEAFSPNVLLRPMVQDTLLPTAAYIAGPAEIAYFAQASVVYRRLLGRMPVIMPRASITLVDARAARTLRKYGLEFTDILRGRRFVRSRMERAILPKALAARFDANEKLLRKMLASLRRPVIKLDKTLDGALGTAERKMLYQFAKLRGKAGRAMALRSSVLDSHERELMAHLLPEGDLQERSLCFLPALASQGVALLDELSQRITPGGTQHQVLFL